METLQIDGTTYQKVSSAARDTGYTADYVGQLCRAGKINAKLVGRTWYVEKEAIGGHKREKVRSNSSKTRESLASELKVHSESNRSTPVAMHPLFAPARRTHLLDAEVRYESDEDHLMPTVKRTHVEEPTHQIPVQKSIDVLSEEETPEVVPELAKPVVKWNGTIVVAPVEETEAVNEVVTDTSESTHTSLSEEVFQPSKPRIQAQGAVKKSENFLTEEEKEDFLGISHKQATRTPVVYVSKLPVVLATLVTCAFLTSATFLQSVWVYESGTPTSQPYMTTAYDVASVANIASLIAK